MRRECQPNLASMFASPLPAEAAEIGVQAELDRAVRSICGRYIAGGILLRAGSLWVSVPRDVDGAKATRCALEFIDCKGAAR
jgi:hypothetical protein